MVGTSIAFPAFFFRRKKRIFASGSSRYSDHMLATQSNAYWTAVLERDASWDGKFFYGVKSTGIYCRPSCPSRRPGDIANVDFFPSMTDAESAGFRACLRCQPDKKAHSVILDICRYLEQNLDHTPGLGELSEKFQLSPYHLQRTFKAVTGISPRKYVEACRLKAFREQLQSGGAITTAIYDAGYGSSSRLYEKTNEHLGMTPGLYRRGGAGMVIRFAS